MAAKAVPARGSGVSPRGAAVGGPGLGSPHPRLASSFSALGTGPLAKALSLWTPLPHLRKGGFSHSATLGTDVLKAQHPPRPGDPTNRPLFDTSWSPALRAPQPPRARFGDPVLHARLRRGAVPAARPSASLSPASGRLQWPPELTAQAARERAPRLPRRDCPALASRGPLHPRFPQAALRALLRPRERCSVINPG